MCIVVRDINVGYESDLQEHCPEFISDRCEQPPFNVVNARTSTSTSIFE